MKAASHIDSSGHLVIHVDAADTITLDTVHGKANLTAADFHFLV